MSIYGSRSYLMPDGRHKQTKIDMSVRLVSARRSPAHVLFIRKLPCVACAAPPPSQAAHVRIGTDGGVGLKPSDRFAVPLCAPCHRQQHNGGERSFWASRGIDPLAVASLLWKLSGNVTAGTRQAYRAKWIKIAVLIEDELPAHN